MLACAGGHGRLIKLLLRKGAELDAQDAGGLTALQHAVVSGHRAVAQHLLRAGADATLRNRTGVDAAQLIAAWAAQQQLQVQEEQPQERGAPGGQLEEQPLLQQQQLQQLSQSAPQV